ncbi:MAG: primosomal protein N', partial [Planctomycetota bacterium]|nr:primosomal protein N' [Planctomycetota bacterium]
PSSLGSHHPVRDRINSANLSHPAPNAHTGDRRVGRLWVATALAGKIAKRARTSGSSAQADQFSEPVERTEPHILTAHQQEAFDKITGSLRSLSAIGDLLTVARTGGSVLATDGRRPASGGQSRSIEQIPEPEIPNSKSQIPNPKNVFLLHGITGSGKTEIYLRTMAEVVKTGKQTIVLVPEIALTEQTIRRFRERFGDEVAVLHSHLTDKQRLVQWQRIKNGEASVVIGARSAVFAPTKNLGLIVIDEEHETSFKQPAIPLYHAREVAIKRAELENAIVILGSATPSLESYYRSLHGEYELLTLPERIEKRPLPKVEIIDMLGEQTHKQESKRPSSVFSARMESSIKEEVSAGNQVIVFLNRRGFITLIKCFRCGFVLRCHRCQISLTYHKQFDRALCHYCNEKTPLPTVCPDCGHDALKLIGTGTEKVEEALRKIQIPKETGIREISVRRMDSDAMRKRTSYKEVLHSFYLGETDILIGTQMIAKGLDYPNVTLVGIVSADTVLYLKDFRSAERTFQLITQVAGRTGRGIKGGRVLVQTLNPTHYSIIAASKHDYESFARQELLYRHELNYPPFSHIIRIVVSGRNQERVKETIETLSGKMQIQLTELLAGGSLEILGPAPAPILKIRDKYRWHLVLKLSRFSGTVVQKHLKETFKMPFAKGDVIITIDTDPTNML